MYYDSEPSTWSGREDTGLTTIAQEERSQHRNRALALARLTLRLESQTQAEEANHKHEQWSQHNALERGNPVRIFGKTGFQLHK